MIPLPKHSFLHTFIESKPSAGNMKTTLQDGSGQRCYRFLVEDVDRHGNTRVYFRRKGCPKIRMTEKPGTEEFDRHYKLLFADKFEKPDPKNPEAVMPGTVRWLAMKYMASKAFAKLDESTRSARRSILDKVCMSKEGKARYMHMRPQDVGRLRDQLAETPEAANKRVKTIRVMYGWAMLPETDISPKPLANPAAGVKTLEPNKVGGHTAWLESQIEEYEAAYPTGTEDRLAIDLMIYTGVRRSDVIRLGPANVQNGYLVFHEYKGRNKTPKRHRLRILPPLQASIDATPTTGSFFLTGNKGKSKGQQRTEHAFNSWFKKLCTRIGLPDDLTPHGLRKAAALRAVRAGATAHELMAMFGWRSLSMAERYTRAFHVEQMEQRGMDRLWEALERSAKPQWKAANDEGSSIDRAAG